MGALVSVVIPTYNGAAYLAETIDSVLAQDHAQTEIIVVDDGSTDRTREVLLAYADRLRIIERSNGGPAAARNAGLADARGEYVAFVDADDVWLPGKLSAQVRHLDGHPDIGAVFSRWHVWQPDAAGRFVPPRQIVSRRVTADVDREHSGWLYTRLLLDCEMLTSTVMLRASLIRQLGGFDASLPSGEDYDCWLRASREARIDKLESTTVLYRLHGASLTRSPRPVDYEQTVVRRALDRWGPDGPDGGRVDPVALQRRLDRLELAHASAHLAGGDPAIAYRLFCQASRRRPASLRLRIGAARAAWKALRRPSSP